MPCVRTVCIVGLSHQWHCCSDPNRFVDELNNAQEQACCNTCAEPLSCMRYCMAYNYHALFEALIQR